MIYKVDKHKSNLTFAFAWSGSKKEKWKENESKNMTPSPVWEGVRAASASRNYDLYSRYT